MVQNKYLILLLLSSYNLCKNGSKSFFYYPTLTIRNYLGPIIKQNLNKDILIKGINAKLNPFLLAFYDNSLIFRNTLTKCRMPPKDI